MELLDGGGELVFADGLQSYQFPTTTMMSDSIQHDGHLLNNSNVIARGSPGTQKQVTARAAEADRGRVGGSQ